MAFTQQNSWTKYLIFGLSVFLIFILLFESQIEPPQFVKWIGRGHPLILHFPIVLLLIAIYINFAQLLTFYPKFNWKAVLVVVAVYSGAKDTALYAVEQQSGEGR